MNKKLIALSVMGVALQAIPQAYAQPSQTKNATSSTEITLGAVFLQPTGTVLDYAVLGTTEPTLSPRWNVATINPGYTAGFELGGRYHTQNAAHDVQINWTHVATRDSSVTHAGSTEIAVPMFQVQTDLTNPSQQAQATAQFNYDIVNLNAGQWVDYGHSTEMRFYAGLSGGQLKETLTRSYKDNAATFMQTSENVSKFTGAGPLFGISGVYNLPFHLDLKGAVSASALIGQMQPSTNFSSSSSDLEDIGVSTNYQAISPADSTQVVPGLTAQLGLSYAHAFNHGGLVTIDAGYQAATYFNAIVAYNPSAVSSEISLGSLNITALEKSVSNFSMNGPYVKVTMQFG